MSIGLERSELPPPVRDRRDRPYELSETCWERLYATYATIVVLGAWQYGVPRARYRDPGEARARAAVCEKQTIQIQSIKRQGSSKECTLRRRNGKQQGDSALPFLYYIKAAVHAFN